MVKPIVVGDQERISLTPSETRYVALMLAMNQNKLQIDHREYAAITGLANAATAATRIRQILNKLKEMTPDASGDGTTPPKPQTPKAGRKRAANGDGNSSGKKKAKADDGILAATSTDVIKPKAAPEVQQEVKQECKRGFTYDDDCPNGNGNAVEEYAPKYERSQGLKKLKTEDDEGYDSVGTVIPNDLQ